MRISPKFERLGGVKTQWMRSSVPKPLSFSQRPHRVGGIQCHRLGMGREWEEQWVRRITAIQQAGLLGTNCWTETEEKKYETGWADGMRSGASVLRTRTTSTLPPRGPGCMKSCWPFTQTRDDLVISANRELAMRPSFFWLELREVALGKLCFHPQPAGAGVRNPAN